MTVDELLARTPQVIAEIVGGTSYVLGPIDGTGADLALCPHVQARFSSRTGRVSVSPAITKRIAAFIQRTNYSGRRSLSANESAERFELAVDKAAWVAMIAACLRGTGPASPELMALEYSTLWRYPYGHTMVNGIPEALALVIVNPVAQALGILERDPRFAEVEPAQTYYVAQAAIITSILGDIAHGIGTHPVKELIGLARAGSGELAHWTLARKWSQ